MAHYDALGELAPHARRQVEALAEVSDRLLVVSTADLRDPADVAFLTSHGELVQRANEGYDFFSYKVGLDAVPDAADYDLVVVCNDSYVGPLRPYRRIVEEMRERPVDFWGLTTTRRRGEHVQSYFVAFRPWVVRSAAFTGFWSAMTPISDRREVITRYELGLSATLRAAGFRAGGYFEETGADRRLARARMAWWAWHAASARPDMPRLATWRRMRREPWNPVAALADRALDGGRLPLAKIDTFRYDPFRLGSDALLRACERAFPEAFDGVRDHLERTAALYPPRPKESDGPTVPPWPVRATIGYPR
ncbi:MAG: rhamnan synthesis F family protein [Kineosporiaceae bacterium]